MTFSTGPWTRRHLLASAGGAGLLTVVPESAARALAAARSRPWRIFMVLGRGESDNEAGFRDHLRRHSVPVEYTVRNGGADPGRLAEIVREVKEAQPDLIYTWGTPQTLAVAGPWDAVDPARHVTGIPIVFTFVAAPVEAKIVRDLRQPGRPVTGTIHIAPVAVQLNTILAYRRIARLGVVYNPLEQNSVLAVAALRVHAQERGVALLTEPVPISADRKPIADAIPDLVARLATNGAEMLYIGPDTFVAFTARSALASAALKHRLPTFSVTELIVRSDRAMMALASSSFGIGRFTAHKAMQILIDGIPPAKIPVETLQRFSVLINMPVVRELEYYPPINLLNFAEVIDG